jgi:hypothetical protein
LKNSEASLLFNISRNTINLWLKRLFVTGYFQALLNLQVIVVLIIDWKKLCELGLFYGDKTQAEIAKKWEADISVNTYSSNFNKIDKCWSWLKASQYLLVKDSRGNQKPGFLKKQGF